MKKYTQADFNALERDENGYLHLASGDWTDVYFDDAQNLVIGAGSRIASNRIGDGSQIGEGCEIGADGNGVVIGKNCRIGRGCKLIDWGIGEGSTLAAGCELCSHDIQNAPYHLQGQVWWRLGAEYRVPDGVFLHSTLASELNAFEGSEQFEVRRKLWYAVMHDYEDEDSSNGSEDFFEALRMAKEYRDEGDEDAHIDVFEEEFCIGEITDLYGWDEDDEK